MARPLHWIRNDMMTKVQRHLVALALIAAISLALVPPWGVQAQEDEVAQLMSQMSSAAKVGQLFLVTFPGSEVDGRSAITELIRDYHVGGVVLKPENGNINNEGNTPAQVATLVSRLQEIAWQSTQPLTNTVSGPFVPLLVAVNQEGNGMPFTSVISGTTALPSQMALGATWNLSHTTTVGQIAGQELSAMGINMLLGPSLDVLENPRPASSGDLGVRTFGGEPFWVGEMGKAYIRGVHEGSEGRMAVMPKHFPGLGSSDRSLDDEISTVQRTLEKLKQVDLAPFFAVAQARDPSSRPDGVLVSHIRFQGLAGGRFITTSPISVDSNVLQQLLALPEMSAWREAGGVTLSDGLGLRALRRFYAPSEQTFNGRRIAQDAFLAGNDLLLLSQFSLSGGWDDQITNIESTISFFREKYESEPSFQQQVDEAVARILRLKLSLYGSSFSLTNIQPDPENVNEAIEPDVEAVSAIARDALTLLSPPSPDLVPSPPTRDDRVVIFTDARTGRPCATCEPVPYVDPRALEETVVQFYGPSATGQIDPGLISSFTFDDLDTHLDTLSLSPTPTPTAGEGITPTVEPPSRLEVALQNADWIIFGMLNPENGPPQSDVIQRFLAERVSALRGPQVVVMAYDIPYCLDATEISKLSAYYASYGHLMPSIKASVRALFGEFAPQGDPPVSVVGVNYDLLTQTSPDPEQTIQVYYSVSSSVSEGEGTPPPEGEEPTPQPTEEGQPTGEPGEEAQPTAEPRVEKGDQIRLRTGTIFDHNEHIVPDGTPVQFFFNYPQEGLEQSVLATTHNGIAETALTLDRTGRLDISVQADPVPREVALQIMIQEEGAATIVTPTPPPTDVPTPTPTPTPPATATAEPTVSPIPAATSEPGGGSSRTPSGQGMHILDLMAALIGVVVVSASGYYAMRLGDRTVTKAFRVALWCMIGGLSLYSIYAFGLSYLGLFDGHGGPWTAGGTALVGGAISLLSAWLLEQREWSGRARLSK
jgi:beta-N-acetylhexosaminidase